MPQLDFSTFAPQLIWLAIVFTGLYLVMARFALPKVGGAIEQRQRRIAEDLGTAERLKEETERANAAYEAALAKARAEAHGIDREIHQRIAAEIDKERQALDARLGAELAKAEAQIAATKSRALGEIKAVASDTAGEIVSALIGAAVPREAVARAVDAAMRN
jgi:F-type H+-transporting ATPase subunit b